MQVKQLNNAVDVADIDLTDVTSWKDLGHIVGRESVVCVRQALPEADFFKLVNSWGDPSRTLIHKYWGDFH